MEKLVLIPFTIVGLFFLVISIIMLMEGIIVGIPFLGVSSCFVMVGLFNLFRKNDPPTRVGYDIETDIEHETIVGIMDNIDTAAGKTSSAEARLKEVHSLYEQRLITTEEYEQKRKEILEEL